MPREYTCTGMLFPSDVHNLIFQGLAILLRASQCSSLVLHAEFSFHDFNETTCFFLPMPPMKGWMLFSVHISMYRCLCVCVDYQSVPDCCFHWSCFSGPYVSVCPLHLFLFKHIWFRNKGMPVISLTCSFFMSFFEKEQLDRRTIKI